MFTGYSIFVVASPANRSLVVNA